ncbi:sugar phosphate isomerase/epimerase [Planotetraspora sp. A-T 1434]|uniref:sugar phosphate isomerase/epimerase family protein n=1 Tax=Planotetraspora sp. A-T 1434 TaxID=2979219 RepID=UPI0021C0E959|nr:sugar phosphate isomerase/epimerase [Planotetraspora sp. A-T 1434]MCT9932687.1 sugar phosphate isomerase/epimerase [Planotetraspora sp. A-T 1434]
MKIAGAPISWGVCEVPGWGYQLAPDRVLQEMRDLGLAATELGPDGFLPSSPGSRRSLLDGYGLRAIGGFVPVVLHDPGHDPLPGVRELLGSFREGSVEVMVLAAATGVDGYDGRPALDATGWETLLGNLDRILKEAAGADGPLVTLHPHVGTMVETRDEVRRVIDGCAVPLCLDTGHLLIGGTDPLEIVREAPGRVAHAHLKDVDSAMAEQVREGRLTYTEAVGKGIYRPLGTGDVDVAGIVSGLGMAGYDGWYVMEQDVVLDGEPPAGEGPIGDVRASMDYLKGLSDD